ncbi:hypothetical protein BMS3Abin04_02430 [bacterium BMS3Abin04]|nr:hypothetical protein BMS3Abin04_02430 [bacterium BMS3Abin04]
MFGLRLTFAIKLYFNESEGDSEPINQSLCFSVFPLLSQFTIKGNSSVLTLFELLRDNPIVVSEVIDMFSFNFKYP